MGSNSNSGGNYQPSAHQINNDRYAADPSGFESPYAAGANTSMGGKGAPPAPDYIGSAEAQGQSGQQAIAQQTQANRPNQNGPFGSVGWTQDANGNWTQNTSLAPGLQGAANNLQVQIANQGPLDNGSAARDQAINAAYSQATSRLNPQFAQQDQLQASQLANEGLDPNSQAYRTQMQQYGQQKNDAYNQAMYSAIGQGTAAQQATFSENLAAQQNPYQQLGMLQGFANGQPGFQAAGAYQPTQYLPASIASGDFGLQGAQANNQFFADTATGLGELGGAAVKASDERVKQNVHRTPAEVVPGVPLATFEYKGHPGRTHVGVIAQDVEKVMPQAISEAPGGTKLVDYSFLGFKPFSFGGDK